MAQEKLPHEENKIESESEIIVRHNFEMMNKEMLRFLSSESLGGNAGAVDIEGVGYSCAAANGYADRETGRIIVFDNYQNVSKEIVQNNTRFTLKVAFGFKEGGFFKIVDFLGSEHFSPKGAQAIAKAVELFNLNREKKKLNRFGS